MGEISCDGFFILDEVQIDGKINLAQGQVAVSGRISDRNNQKTRNSDTF